MSNTIDNYIIIIFSIVINPTHAIHTCLFITENYSSRITIMSFWALALKSPAENHIPKKSLDTSQCDPSVWECWGVGAKNYLPVSLLSVVSIVFEKFVKNRLVDHLKKYDLSSDFQYQCCK